jgi:hypothetical protein
MTQTAFGKVRINNKVYLYMVKLSGNERIYSRVNSAPCKTSLNCDEKFLSLLTSDKNILTAFLSGVEIVLRKP